MPQLCTNEAHWAKVCRSLHTLRTTLLHQAGTSWSREITLGMYTTPGSWGPPMKLRVQHDYMARRFTIQSGFGGEMQWTHEEFTEVKRWLARFAADWQAHKLAKVM